MKRTKSILSALTAILALAQAALAGPPLICHALDIGGAKSLPWNEEASYSSGSGWSLSGNSHYDLSRLVPDTLGLLAPTMPVIVRMETIRRATLYANQDPQIAKELLLKLRARALEAEKQGHPDALAWFDLGYLVECYKQANLSYRQLDSGGWEPVIHANPASNLDGYAWVKKAISLRGEDSEMEFAAALITLEGPADQRSQRPEHTRRAMAGVASDPLLAANLKNHFGGKTSKSSKGDTLAEMLARTESTETARK